MENTYYISIATCNITLDVTCCPKSVYGSLYSNHNTLCACTCQVYKKSKNIKNDLWGQSQIHTILSSVVTEQSTVNIKLSHVPDDSDITVYYINQYLCGLTIQTDLVLRIADLRNFSIRDMWIIVVSVCWFLIDTVQLLSSLIQSVQQSESLVIQVWKRPSPRPKYKKWSLKKYEPSSNQISLISCPTNPHR